MAQIAEKLLKLVLFYKIILLSLSILISGAIIVILVSPDKDLISIIREDVFKEIGIALIIIGFAILFYEYFLRRNMMDLIEEFFRTNFMFMITQHCEKVKSISESVRKSGLLNVYKKGGSTDILDLATKNIKLLGVSLNYYFYPDSDEWTRLKSIVEEGCTLQILILNPDSPHVAYREKDENNENLKGQIIRLHNLEKEFMKNLKDEFKQNVEIRFYDNYPLCAMTIIDENLMRVTPYLYNKRRRACPTMEFTRSKDGIFESYLEHFNDLWKKAENIGMK
ncbi:MAG: DUF5919 domain-containing protein [Candidatus Methanoperedens sp.]|nr:DUF5919 domain-containing protein [Candidatus Methanoperedens sp.]MCZ7371275.1 DUF5919 domain-containing protein [Candidatus Methanoperedens sp.]